MLFHTVLLSILFSIVHSQGGCYIHKDSFFSYETQNNTIKITASKIGRNGWFAVGFGSSPDIQKAKMYLGNSNGVKKLENYSDPGIPYPSNTFTTLENNRDILNNLMVWSANIDKKEVRNSSYAFLARSEDKLFINGKETVGVLKFNLNIPMHTSCDRYELVSVGNIFSTFWPLTFPGLGFFIGALLLMVYLRNEEPLNSRKIVPFFASFVQLSLIFTQRISLSIGYEKRLEVDCIKNIFYYPWIVLGIIGNLVNITRFIYIINIGRVSVNDYTIKENGEVKVSWKYKILLYMNSFPVIATSFIPMYVLVAIPYLLLYLILYTTRDCQAISYLQIFIIAIQIVIASLISVVLLVIDLVINYKLILKCRWIDYLFRKDPNLFRIEAIPILLLSPIMFSVVLPGNVGLVRSIVYFTTYNMFLFWISGGFVLSATIFNILFKKCKKSKENDVGYVFALKDEKLRKVFMKFAEKEFNTENILIKLDIMEYMETHKKGNRKDLALKIQKKYLNGNLSDYELNVEETKRSKLLVRLESEEFDEDLFKEINETVNSNLLDMFNRFKLTKDYIEYRDIHLIKSRIM